MVLCYAMIKQKLLYFFGFLNDLLYLCREIEL